METLPGEKKSKEIKENVSTIVWPSSPFSCHYFHRHEHQSHHHRHNHLLTKFWGWRFWLFFEISDVIVPTFIIFVTHNDNPCHLASKRFGGMAHVTCHITCYLTFRFLGLAGWHMSHIIWLWKGFWVWRGGRPEPVDAAAARGERGSMGQARF